ncbi:hypothetical protein N7512_008256 [Penicillium capsulatum]|nr:hypothetical protein N7512_008256 [Penicillium capsulatum]
MCRHTYHHYPVCGHISSFTVSACPEFTNQLRMFASTGQSLVCEEVKMTHDLLSASQPSACVECERKWREMVTRGSPDAIRSRANSTIEGLATTSPIFQVAVRMTLDEENDSLPTEDVECGDERCDIYLDIAREHDRPCDCCGPAQPSQEDVIVIQIATLEGTTGREQSASNATDDPSVIAQPRPVVPDSVIRSSLFTYVSKWLEEVEDCHEQDEEPLDLLGEIPTRPRFVPRRFDIFADTHHRTTNSMDQPDTHESQQSYPECCTRIDLLEDLPPRGELITNLCQALKTTPPGSDLMELESISAADPEQPRMSDTRSTYPSTISSGLWHAVMSSASSPDFLLSQESDGDGYNWLPSRKMSPLPRVPGILRTLPLKSETEVDDDDFQSFDEDSTHPVTDRQPTPFVAPADIPPTGSIASLHGRHFRGCGPLAWTPLSFANRGFLHGVLEVFHVHWGSCWCCLIVVL